MKKLQTSILTKNQKKQYGPKLFTSDGVQFKIVTTVRYDDKCGNGHNSFSITGWMYQKAKNNHWIDSGGGCIHDEIKEHFPELAYLIKWHLCASDGPMHYLANTLYHAGDRDCWGKLKGEPYNYKSKLKFKDLPFVFEFSQAFLKWLQPQVNKLTTFEIVEVPHKEEKDGYKFDPKYTFSGFDCEWYQCPFDTKNEAQQFREAFATIPALFVSEPTSWGEGKEPDLEAAKSTAIWPEATLEQLQDKAALTARLPGLMEEFKKDVESLGFVY